MKSHTKLRAGIIGIGLTFFILLRLLSAYPDIVETYYSNGIYPVLKAFVSFPTGQFQFSISEFLIFFLVLICAPLYIRRIFKKKIRLYRILLNFTTFTALIYIWFSLFWGINYFRLPLEEKLNLMDEGLSHQAFDSVFVDLIRQTNAFNVKYGMENFTQINQTIEAAYRKTFKDLDLPFTPETRTVKTIASNWLLNKTMTSGFFSPFFFEVHINSDLFVFELPFTIAHEKAHLMGYTSEAEANFLAFMVCINAENALCQYSGYYAILKYFLAAIAPNKDSYDDLTKMISEGVQHDIHAVYERWRSHQSFVADFSARTYDLYLKANQIEEGITNYSRVVQLVVQYKAVQKK